MIILHPVSKSIPRPRDVFFSFSVFFFHNVLLLVHGGGYRGWWHGAGGGQAAFLTLTSDIQNLCQYTEDTQWESK